MHIPRLVFAEERRSDKIASSILMASVLKNIGAPVSFFCTGHDERYIRLLELVTGQKPAILDPFACGSNRNMRLLFQEASSTRSLNVIFCDMGVRQEPGVFSVNPLPGEIARILDSPLVVSLYADNPAAVTSRVLDTVTKQISSQGVQPSAVVFSSAFNPREYQLLENEVGRRTDLLSLGFIPKTLEKDSPALMELCLKEMAAKAVFPIKAATVQLQGMMNQIEWEILWGIGKRGAKWSEVSDSLKKSAAGLRVGILTNPASDLDGNNAEVFFNYIGCSTITIPLDGPAPEAGLDALYIPHTPGFLCAERLLGKSGLRDWFVSFFLSGNPVLVCGAVTLLLGDSFSLPNGKRYDGLKLFPFHGVFDIPGPGSMKRVEATSSFDGDIMLNRGEKIRGHLPVYASVIDPGNASGAAWVIQDPAKSAETGLSGWSKASAVATEIGLELWSNMEGVLRWLLKRKQ
ncbi:MAG: hypothetical protein WCY56_01965 [Aminobacteriaceae bacterium]